MARASKTRRLRVSSPAGAQPALWKRDFPEKSASWLPRACPGGRGPSPALVSLFVLLGEAKESGVNSLSMGAECGNLEPRTGFAQSGAETLHPHLRP